MPSFLLQNWIEIFLAAVLLQNCLRNTWEWLRQCLYWSQRSDCVGGTSICHLSCWATKAVFHSSMAFGQVASSIRSLGHCACVAFHWASKVKDILGDICCFSGQFLLASLGICWHTEISAGAPESPWEKGFGSSETTLVSKQLSYFCYVDIPWHFSTNVVAFSVYWPFWLTSKNNYFQMHVK